MILVVATYDSQPAQRMLGLGSFLVDVGYQLQPTVTMDCRSMRHYRILVPDPWSETNGGSQ